MVGASLPRAGKLRPAALPQAQVWVIVSTEFWRRKLGTIQSISPTPVKNINSGENTGQSGPFLQPREQSVLKNFLSRITEFFFFTLIAPQTLLGIPYLFQIFLG